MPEANYELSQDGSFTIENYNHAKPFASFFPGVAGPKGTPMWCFYVNRAQCVSSFGLRDKEQSITEFLPADKAWNFTSVTGFRTFLKITDEHGIAFYEPFARNAPEESDGITQKMTILPSEIILEDTNDNLGIVTTMTAQTVPGRSWAGLARTLSVKNTGDKKISVELVDGLPSILPYGVHTYLIKHMSRTTEAWMNTENISNTAYFKLKVEMLDKPGIEYIKAGNFYVNYLESPANVSKTGVIVDPAHVFGNRADFNVPYEFKRSTPFECPKFVQSDNKMPSAMSFHSFELAKGAEKTVYTVIGHATDKEKYKKIREEINADFFADITAQNRALIKQVTDHILCRTASAEFDNYCAQSFLDNVLRGGMPIKIENAPDNMHFYVYSRKHGDTERDYNKFSLLPEYYSCGNGNYRDINQNRRSDTRFFPFVEDDNLVTFMNLLQLDGFNPLHVYGSVFTLEASKAVFSKKIGTALKKDEKSKLFDFAQTPFTPGSVLRFLEDELKLKEPKTSQITGKMLELSVKTEKAEHGEGFWSDHWHYNMDLLENYLEVFPENSRKLMFDRKDFTFFDSDHFVAPRSSKHVLSNGQPRQFGSVQKSGQKATLIASRKQHPNVVRTNSGEGKIYKTSLFVKLLCVVANKAASLDPEGRGIELESDKPNWYDALNGLPGLFGSSLNETFELKRLIELLLAKIEETGIKDDKKIDLPEELEKYIKGLVKLLGKLGKLKNTQFEYWDKATSLKEDYRQKVFMGISGTQKQMKVKDIKEFFAALLARVEDGIARSVDEKTGVYHSYFMCEATKYSANKDKKGKKALSPDGLETVTVKKFKQIPLPNFLEGQMHALRTSKDTNSAKHIVETVKKSPLFDKKLKMYKVNASLKDAIDEIGRTKIFAAGWLENESIWMHMQYKYLLEILRTGLFDDFYKELKNVLIAYQDPKVYGRSILENSSFIASSAFSDKNLHGNGFVARLSGATAELAQIWQYMMFGQRPFRYDTKNGLVLEFSPALSKELFTTQASTIEVSGCEKAQNIGKNSVACMFLGAIPVVYTNAKRKNTFGKDKASVSAYELIDAKGAKTKVTGSCIKGELAEKIRQGEFKRINVELS